MPITEPQRSVLLLPLRWRRRASCARAVAFARPRPRHVGRAGGGSPSVFPRAALRHSWPRRIERAGGRLFDRRAWSRRAGDRRRVRRAAIRFLRPVARRDDRAMARGQRAGASDTPRTRQHDVAVDRSAADGGPPARGAREGYVGDRGPGDGPVLFAGRSWPRLRRTWQPRAARCCPRILLATPAAARPFGTWITRRSSRRSTCPRS